MVSQDIIKKIQKIFDAEPSKIEETTEFKNIGHTELIEVFSAWAKRHEHIFGETIKIDKTHSLQEHGVDFVIHLITSNRKIGVQVEFYSDIKQKDFTSNLNTQIVNSKTYDLECFCIIFCGDMTDQSQNQRISGRISLFQRRNDPYVQFFGPQKAMTVYKDFKADARRFGGISISEPLPAIDNFIGREKELEKVREAIQNKKVTIIQGVAGIGKTYIAAKIARELQPQKKLFWHTFPETGDSFDLVTDKLSKFFAYFGDSALLDYIREGGADINEKMHAIINSLEQGDYLMFFDNYQYVTDGNIHELLRMLTSKGSKARGIVITRRIPPIYETWDKVSVIEQKIEGLDLEESKELFEVLELPIDEESAAEAHKLTKGHPISLNTFTVLAKGSTPDKALEEITEYKENVDKYLLREVYNKSTKEEQRFLCAATIFDEAVPARAYEIVLGKRFSKEVLEGLKNRFLLKMKKEDKTYYPQDIIKDFAYEQLKVKERKEFHERAADYYQSLEKTSENILETVYHFGMAGLRENAKRCLVENIYFLKKPAYSISDSDWQYLSGLWKSCSWKDLETFATSLFRFAGFKCDTDIRTTTEQFDLIVENTFQNPFWYDKGLFFPVECKRRKEKVNSRMIRDFWGKIVTRKWKIGFFISQSGFTGGETSATNQVIRDAFETHDIVIVTLSKKDIEKLLKEKIDPFVFLEYAIKETLKKLHLPELFKGKQ